jgi:hypothetical protein
MKWPLMSDEELHIFGIDIILPFLKNEGVTVEAVNRDPKLTPQIIGQRWGSLAYIYVRTAMLPNMGSLTEAQFMHGLDWAESNHATAFFASVGLLCTDYPDKSPVIDEDDKLLPIRNGGFMANYKGLVVMMTTNRVRVMGQDK